MIFDVGELCDDIYIVLSGAVEIALTDNINYEMMDMMGKGSVIGINNVLVKEKWCYKAISRSSESTSVIKIPKAIVESLMN